MVLNAPLLAVTTWPLPAPTERVVAVLVLDPLPQLVNIAAVAMIITLASLRAIAETLLDSSAGRPGLDPLTDWPETRAAADLVFALRGHDLSVARRALRLELLAAEVLVADQDHVKASALGVPSGANRACRRNPQERRLWLAQQP
jgi:hypothetical protein